MQNQPLPILIFAQSARFIAQSATQAGFSVWVADCFCDQDTIEVAQRHHKLPALSTVNQPQLLKCLIDLADGEACQLVCGTGIEQFSVILSQLPPNIQLVGNTSATIKHLKTPAHFFALLNQLELPYPETQYTPPSNTENWLCKPNTGSGGMNICLANDAKHNNPGYYQRYISGINGSALFLSTGKQMQILSINQQYCGYQQTQPFRLQQIDTPLNLSWLIKAELSDAINKLVTATGLIGINSIDFILDRDQQLFLLEVNPRLSASAELLQLPLPVFRYHYAASLNKINPDLGQPDLAPRRLVYLFADIAYRIPRQMDWPSQCRDIPPAETCIQTGEPICTLILQADNAGMLDLTQQKLTQQITENLHKLS